MVDSSVSRPAHPETIRRIRQQFELANLNLREQCNIVEAVTGSVAQNWTDLDANTLLAMMISKGTQNLKAWSAEIEAAA